MTFEALVVEAWRFVVHLGQSCYPLTFDFEKNLDSKAVLQLLIWTSQNLHRKMTTYLVSCQSCTKLAVTLVFLAAGWGVSMIYFPFGSLVCSFFLRCFFSAARHSVDRRLTLPCREFQESSSFG